LHSKDTQAARLKDSQAELIRRALAALEERFGIPQEHFRDFHLFVRSRDVWCSTPEAGKAEFSRVVRRGIRIARVFEHSVRPTTNAVQLLGHLVARNRLYLDERQTRLFLAGETQEVKVPGGVSEGFVVAFHRRGRGEELALGIGLLKGRKLKSQVPRSRRVIG